MTIRLADGFRPRNRSASVSGPAVMPKNASAMEAVPFLWIAGIADPIVFHGKDYVFDRGGKHPKSKYMVTASMHLSTPFQSRGTIIEWLKGL